MAKGGWQHFTERASKDAYKNQARTHPAIIITSVMGVCTTARLCWGYSISGDDLVSLMRYFYKHDPQRKGSRPPSHCLEIDLDELEKYFTPILNAELYGGAFSYKAMYGELDGTYGVMIMDEGVPVARVDRWGRDNCK